MAAKPLQRSRAAPTTRRDVLDAVEGVRDIAEQLKVELLGSEDPSSPNRGQRGQIADHEKRIRVLESDQAKAMALMEGIEKAVQRIEKKFEPGTPAAQATQALEMAKEQETLNKQRFRNAMWLGAAAVLTAVATLLLKVAGT